MERSDAASEAAQDLLLEEAEARGEGAWAIAWKQFRKHKLAVAGLVLVLLLFVTAIFAPLLANDLPIYVKAALPARYEKAFWAYDAAHRSLPGLLKAATRDEVKIERAAVSLVERLEDASTLVADELAGPMKEALPKYRAAIAAARAPGGAVDKASWDALREGLEPLSPDGEVKLAVRSFWPIFRILDGTELFFLGAFAGVLLLPLASRAIDGFGRRRLMDPFHLLGMKLLFLAAVPTVVALAVPAISPRKQDPDRKLYKSLALEAAKNPASGTVVIFPLVPYGENENILEDQRAKPTWLLSEDERMARVVPDLWKKREARREAIIQEKFPERAARRREIALLLDRSQKELLKRSVFFRAWKSLTPEEETTRLRAEAAAIDEELTKGIAAQATELDVELKAAYEKRKGELRMHWLGTDTNGRDVLARMVYGARVSMSVGFVAEGIAVAIGIVLGALAGYFRGWVDIALSRVIEVVICFPVFFFILTILAFLPQSIVNIMIVIGITGWPGIARLMRAEFLRLSNLDFVTAGKALGLSDTRIIFRHIMPNGLAPILVSTTFGIAGAILVEAALSFLGFGVPQPTASWGDTLNNGAADPQGTWWLTVFPGTALFLTVTAYNLVGDAIRDATDPRLRQ